METVDIKILEFSFRFRRLSWRQEFAIKFEPKADPYRVLLAHALKSVSGRVIETVVEATKVIDSLPTPILMRVYKVWKGSFPASRKFITANLYQAPEPVAYDAILRAEEAEQEEALDPEEAAVAAKYGKGQLDEARELGQKILKASKLRGATRASDDNL